MSASVIVANMWDHVEVVGAVDPAAPPTGGDLDALADKLTAQNCGVRPVVRVLEQLTIPAFVVDDPGPTCEELHEDGWRRYVRRMGRVVAQSRAITYLRAHAWMKSDSRAVPGVGSAPQTEVIMGEQQERKAAPGEAEEPKSGWLARWRERRRSKSARAADIGRRTVEINERNVEKASKYWGR